MGGVEIRRDRGCRTVRAPGWFARWVSAAALIVLGASACTSAVHNASASVPTTVDTDVDKIISTRATALADVTSLASAVRAARAALDVAEMGDDDAAAAPIKDAAAKTGVAGPIAARARSDVLSYQKALSAAAAEAAKPRTALDDAQRAALQNADTAGRAEALAIRSSAGSYADSWPTYASLLSSLQAWLQRDRRGDYGSDAQANAALGHLIDPLRADLTSAQARIDSAETGRESASAAMATVLADVRVTFPLATASPSGS